VPQFLLPEAPGQLLAQGWADGKKGLRQQQQLQQLRQGSPEKI